MPSTTLRTKSHKILQTITLQRVDVKVLYCFMLYTAFLHDHAPLWLVYCVYISKLFYCFFIVFFIIAKK